MDFSVRSDTVPKAGETVIGRSLALAMGGKGANQAVAAARMGGHVAMAGKVGQDVFGDRMCDALRQEGLDMQHVRRDRDVSTGAAFILIEPSGQNRIIVVPGANATYTVEELNEAAAALTQADLLLLQLEIELQVVEAAINLASQQGVPAILNPAPAPKSPLSDDLLGKLRCITPNELEAEAITGIRVEDPDDARRAAETLRDRGARGVVITLGEQGAVVVDDDGCTLVPPHAVDAVDTVAAGDAFTGALAVRLCEGAELVDAARFAAAAAALSVTRHGAMDSIPRRDEVERFFQ